MYQNYHHDTVKTKLKLKIAELKKQLNREEHDERKAHIMGKIKLIEGTIKELR